MRVFMFPGQGSQYVGMGKTIRESFPRGREIFERAEEVTSLPLTRLCFEGPLEELTRTRHLQPALTAVNLVYFEYLTSQGISPEVVCGHSLGEYSALYAAGVLSLEDTFSLVLKRGELMEEASQRRPGAMYAVIGLSREELEELVARASEKGVVVLANHNAPTQIVVTGEEEASTLVAEEAKQKKAKVVKLRVSGAYHSPLMAEAGEEFRKFLKDIPFNPPRVSFFSNVTASRVEDPEEIRALMGEQIERPVRWVEEIENIRAFGGSHFLEVGPKSVLSNLVKKILGSEEVRVEAFETLYL